MKKKDYIFMFSQSCGRRGVIVGCLSLISLHFVIYGFAYVLVHGFLNENQVQRQRHNDVTIVRYKPVERYKLKARDFGDVRVRNESLGNIDLQKEIAETRSVYPHLKHLQPGNATVYNILFMQQPAYLNSYRSPCFTQRRLRKVNEYTLQHIYQLRCLPSLYVVGFTKCGTTDFHARLTQHALVRAGWTKEPHWWDNLHGKNSVLDKYLDMYQSATDRVSQYQQVNRYNHSYYPTIIGDFTPRLAWHGSDWSQDILNINKTEPRILLPHKIKHLTPEAKVIFLVRKPTHRLYSDYLDYMVRYNANRQQPSPTHFHRLVEAAIHWWKSCVAKHSERLCMYDSPGDLPPLDSTSHSYWRHNAADRLRIGLFVLYISEWLKVFEQRSVKVIVLEEYRKNPLKTLSEEVLVFLKLEDFTAEEAKVIEEADVLNSRNVRLDASLDTPMLNSTQQLLNHFYRPYNLKLFDLLDRPPHEEYIAQDLTL